MLARFTRDALTYGGTVVIVRAVGFLLLPVYTRVLTPADYGMVELLMIIAAFAFVTVSLEVGQGAARFLPESSSERRAHYIGASLAYAIPAYTLFAIGLILVSGPVASFLLGQAEAVRLVQVGAVAIAMMGIFQLAHGQLRWLLQASRWAVISIAYVAVSGAVSVMLVTLLQMGPVGILLGSASGAVVGLGLVAVAGKGVYRIRWDRQRLGEVLHFSLPLVPASVAVIVTATVDRLIVNEALGLTDVGIYGVGLRVASIMGVIMIAFQSSLTPLVYALHREPDTPRQISQLLRAFVLAAGMASIGVALFAPEIVAIVAAPDFADASRVVPLLATATIVGGMYVFTPGLVIARRTGVVAIVSIGAATVTTLSGFALVPSLGMAGGAAAALVGAVTLFLGYAIPGAHEYRIPFSWSRVIAVGTIVLAVDIAAILRRSDPGQDLLARAAVFGVCVLAVIALGPIRWSEMKAVGGRVARRWQSGQA